MDLVHDPGVRDEHVERPEFGRERLQAVAHRRPVGDVERAHGAPRARLTHGVRGLRDALVAVADGDVVALAGEPEHDRTPDPCRRARHERRSPLRRHRGAA
jgi:hypothetical protein